MILKGSQRGGPRQLAAHLLNTQDNEHVTVGEIRGFVADDLYGAMAETVAVAKGTKCRQSVFSLSLNPPKDAQVTRDDLYRAVDRAEEALGLTGQSRVVVFHEKHGRLHAHAVWSRIDPEQMKAVNLPFFKTRLREVSKELFLEHGWELPHGLKTNGHKNPLNFTLAEWQQAERLDLDPREIKQIFQSAWARSDDLKSLRAAPEEHGYFLARGDRRGVVAVDVHGEVFALARWSGIKTKQAEQKIGNGENLPGVEAVRADIRSRVSGQMCEFIKQDKAQKAEEMRPLFEAREEMVRRQREARDALKAVQGQRSFEEAKVRADRFRKGFGVVLDVLTGRLFKLRRQNELEAKAGKLRDRKEREDLVRAQLRERRPLHDRIRETLKTQRASRQRMAQRMAALLRRSDASRTKDKSQPATRSLRL